MSTTIPKRVFIIPYRDREEEKKVFITRMHDYLSGQNDWEMYFAHQCDTRPFNRGAMKNIGFLAIKNKYPEHYRDITFIFHDVDNYPRHNGSIPYNTTDGVVSHYYGYNFALGGIFAIKGKDFELVKGFPNFWGWGWEDNIIQDKCIRNHLTIDRSCFFSIGDRENIIQTTNNFIRKYSVNELITYKKGNVEDISHLKDLEWNFDGDFIHITNFSSYVLPKQLTYRLHDIRKGNVIRVRARRRRPMFNIPH